MGRELTYRRFIINVGVCLILFIVAGIITPWIGATFLTPPQVFAVHETSPQQVIFWQLRIPRMVLAAFAGFGLALAGAAFQALLKNPLASPYVLGISAGSSLGAVIAIKIGLAFTLMAAPALFLFALVGALIAVSVVYLLSKERGGLNPATLLLAGVTLNFLFSAVILLIQYISAPGEAYQMIRWMMGAVDIAGYSQLGIVAITLFAGSAVLLLHTRALNILTLDESTAQHLGIDVNHAQKLIFLAASVITAGVVSVCGPIGFVGLIIPHIVRFIVGSDHRLLIPCSGLTGGAFLMIADTLARTIIAPLELPVGVITALSGGPFFLFLLLQYKRRKNLLL